MYGFESLWFVLTMLIAIAFWGFLLWLAWLLVSSIKGVHTELIRIREILTQRPPGSR